MFLRRGSKCTVVLQRKQIGGALPIAIFIIVFMSLLGGAMVRVLSDLNRATISDVYGARSYAAARSGAEIFLTRLFPHDEAVDIEQCEVRSDSEPQTTLQLSFSTQGLTGCSATVSCDRFVLPDPFDGVHFRIISAGSCIVGNQSYSKQIILEASDGVF